MADTTDVKSDHKAPTAADAPTAAGTGANAEDDGRLVVVRTGAGCGQRNNREYILMVMSVACFEDFNRAVLATGEHATCQDWMKQFYLTAIDTPIPMDKMAEFVRSPPINAPVKTWIQEALSYLKYAPDDARPPDKILSELRSL